MGLVITLSIIGTLAATAAVVRPNYLSASAPPETPQPITASHPEHQQAIELLASLISRSKEVLAIHQRGATPYIEIVLWLEDGDNPGQMDPSEVAVLSHSEILQTISFHSLDVEESEESETEDSGGDGGWSDQPGAEKTHEPMLPEIDIRRADFCPAWRETAQVGRRVILARVAEISIEQLTELDPTGSLIRISLTWASESADSPDKASLLLDVSMRSGNSG